MQVFLEKENQQMLKHSKAISFSSFTEFGDSIFQAGATAALPDVILCSADESFAFIRNETYRLFDMLEMNIFEIQPKMDIEIFYEFGGDRFEIGYGTEGMMCLRTDGYDDGVMRANRLYMSPASGARGAMFFYRDRLYKNISFQATDEIIDKVLGEYGRELWSEANATPHHENQLHQVTTTPRDIAVSFLQIANCDYPRRAKRLFFESKFMEIMSRIIVRKLPADESSPDTMGFEESQIKKIPGILMERIGSPPSIPELARELSICETKMKIGFKRIFGEPIYARHRNMCLEQAAMTLLDTDRSIFEIAADAGYSGGGNFSNAFKKRYGVSPSQYRRKDGFL
jgi:AraC-like DNA-binding protein